MSKVINPERLGAQFFFTVLGVALFFWDIPICTAGLNFPATSQAQSLNFGFGWFWSVFQQQVSGNAKNGVDILVISNLKMSWVLGTSLRSHWLIRTHEASAAHGWCHHFYWSHFCPGRDGSMDVGSSSTWRHEKSRGFAEPCDLWCSLECMWEACLIESLDDCSWFWT